ncbi:MAG: hypothetical protein V3S13_03705 [Candidatus Omnitrophota bacterium]
MLRKNPLIYTFILMLAISFVGCAGLQRKFSRKKKKEEKIAPVITTYDYSKELRVDELYKRHFLFWKSWQSELIERIDGSYKKRVSCYDYTVSSLMEMKKYLAGAKAEELESFIAKIKALAPQIKDKRLTKIKGYRMKLLLEKTKRQIDKGFSYSDVKDSLEFKK